MRKVAVLGGLVLALSLSMVYGSAGDKSGDKKPEQKPEPKLNSPPEGFKLLFNGRDLEGWQAQIPINQRAKLEGASNSLTREIFRYWTQNRHLRVDVRCEAGRSGDDPPFNTGWVVHIRIRNTRAGLEHDVILHERPPDPTSLGLSSAARLGSYWANSPMICGTTCLASSAPRARARLSASSGLVSKSLP